MSKFLHAIKRTWLDFCDLTDGKPKWANARKVEASLSTDEQRQRRRELVEAIHVAAALQDRLPRSFATSAEKADKRLTVELTMKETFLIEPELFDYSLQRGLILIGRPDRIHHIFSGGVGLQAYRKRKEIVEGLTPFGKGRTLSRNHVIFRHDDELHAVVQRARERGYNMSIVVHVDPDDRPMKMRNKTG